MSMDVSEILMFLGYVNMAYNVLCNFSSFLYSSGSCLYYGIFPKIFFVNSQDSSFLLPES